MRKKVFNAIISLVLATTVAASLSGCGATEAHAAGGNEAKEASKTGGPIKIGVPSDATNQARAINLLATAGLIKVNPDAGYTPELADVTEYLYNIEIAPAAANTLVATLDDYAASTINGTYAVPAGLSPSKDGLITEVQEVGSDNPYINVIVARTQDKDNETYKKIVDAYQTQTIAEYILEKNKESSVPAFEYDKNYSVEADFVDKLEGYNSDKSGKQVVKIGVCGTADVWKAVQKVLDDENAGIYIEPVIFDAYNLPNEALNSGEIDLNAFQHKAYLQSEIDSQGYDITPIGDTSSAPLTLYSKKVASLDELKELAGKK